MFKMRVVGLCKFCFFAVAFSALNFIVEDDTEFPSVTFPERNHLANFTNSGGVANITIPAEVLQRRSFGS